MALEPLPLGRSEYAGVQRYKGEDFLKYYLERKACGVLGSQTMNSSGVLFPAQHLFLFLMLTTPWFPSGNTRSLTVCMGWVGRTVALGVAMASHHITFLAS